MGTKYSSQSASGYNSAPPSDDGTVSESNKVKWSTTKTKLSDPVKTLADNINTALTTHFDNGPTALTTNTTIDATHYNKFIQVSGSGVTLTLTDASTLAAGWYCDIVNTDASNTVTVARATASNMINEVSSNINLLPLQQIRAVVNAAANGFLISVQARHSKTYNTAEPTNFSSAVSFSGAVTTNSTVAANGAVTLNSTLAANGTVTLTGAAINLAAYVDVASAGTTNIGAAASNNVRITGTTTITAFDSVAAGITRDVRFAGALTLTHNATSLILPTSANITTAADDMASFTSLGSGNWICTKYGRKSGSPLSTGLTLLGSGTFSGAASADITNLMSSSHNDYMLMFDVTSMSGSPVDVYLRFSTNNGSSFYSGANDYYYGTTNTGQIVLTPTTPYVVGASLSGFIYLHNMNSTNTDQHIATGVNYVMGDGSGGSNTVGGGSTLNMSAAINAVRLLPASGTFTGAWRFYGLG